MIKRFFIFFLALFILTPVYGDEVRLLVTEDFDKVVFDRKVSFQEKQSVMEILSDNVEIETAFAGGFVTSINGIKSDKKARKDWFYYINGIMAHKGALEYFPQDRDFIWWDYHEWQNAVYVPALIGCFPEPFLNGYEGQRLPVLILYENEFLTEAKQIKQKLFALGVKQVDTSEFLGSLKNTDDSYIILLGRWPFFNGFKNIQEMYKNYKKLGIFFQLNDEKIILTDIKGKSAEILDNAGLIFAVKFGINKSNPIWFISGNNKKTVQQAVEIILNNSDSLKLKAGLAFNSGKIYEIPVN